MPVIATNLAGLGAGTYDGQPGIIRLGSDFYEEEFTWNASAGRWIGTRTHELISQIDTWGMDLSDYPLESIRQSWCRLRNAIPYGKSKAALTADFVIGTDTSMAVDNLGNFTASGQVFSRGRTWSYSGRSASSGAGNLTGLSLISGTNSGTLPGGDTIVWQLPGDVGGWGSVVRYLDHAGEMYAGGFELEERLKIHLNGSHDDVAMTVGVYYFNFNAGEDIAELGSVASPSGGLGFGITKTGPPDDLQTGRAGERPFQIGNAGWTLLAAGTPTKRFLIPMLFAKMESSTAKDNGEEYGAVLEARWRSIV